MPTREDQSAWRVETVQASKYSRGYEVRTQSGELIKKLYDREEAAEMVKQHNRGIQ